MQPGQPPLAKSKFDLFVLKTASVLMSEPEKLQSSLDRLRDLYHPANIQEEYWLDQIAECQMRLHRLDRLESGLFTHFIDDAKDLGGLSAPESFPAGMREHTELDARQRLNYILAKGYYGRGGAECASTLLQVPRHDGAAASPRTGTVRTHAETAPFHAAATY